MNVDHIKPRSKHPHLSLDLSNLQTLCSSCNCGKLARDETDWRDHRDEQDIMLSRYLDIMADPRS